MDTHHGALMLLGPTMDPRTAFDLSLRLPHLGLRMREHGSRALLFAERLHERGVDVTYPGLSTHPQHALYTAQLNEGYGFGGLLGIDTGSTERAFKLLDILQNDKAFGYSAVSLGYFDTLMSCSASSTSSELSEDDMRDAGIQPGYVRMSLGYTGDVEQRWSQLESALIQIGVLAQASA